MSDFNSSLPIRTENNGDVAVKIVDGTFNSQQLTVNADGSVNITDNGASITVDAENLDIRDLAFATDKVDVSGSTIDLSAASLAALETITAIATDLDLRDLTHVSDSVKIGNGTDFVGVNTDGSINVVVIDGTPGAPINEYGTAVAVASGATSNHNYVVTALKTFYLNQIEASGSSKMKIEVKVNGITKFVQFNSTSDTNMSIRLANPIVATAGQTVQIIRTNRDLQAQDLYSTISGYELP